MAQITIFKKQAGEIKERSYLKPYKGMSQTHVTNPDKAESIVHNLVFDPANPDIANNPILNRKKEQEPKTRYDQQSLYLCGQSDMDQVTPEKLGNQAFSGLQLHQM